MHRILLVSLALTLLGLAVTARSPADARAGLRDGKYLYVVLNGTLRVYRLGTWTAVETKRLPDLRDGVRGVAVNLANDSLYIAHGGDGGPQGTGSLMRWDLLTQTVTWDRAYWFGVDQPAVCDGRVYMPIGEGAPGSAWRILDAGDGHVVGTLFGGGHPHNTICHHGRVYMGGRSARYLIVKNLATMARGRIGPSPSSSPGVRPFTVDGTDSLAYITWTSFRGFSVANIATGRIIATRNFGRVPSSYRPSAPSHGISLSPDGTEVYVMDAPLQRVEVWTAGRSPRHLDNIPIDGLTGTESKCPYDCMKDGWVLHSLDGNYVFVGDSGDVIDTEKRRVVDSISALEDSRHGFLEIDWSSGRPSAASTHFGVG